MAAHPVTRSVQPTATCGHADACQLQQETSSASSARSATAAGDTWTGRSD